MGLMHEQYIFFACTKPIYVLLLLFYFFNSNYGYCLGCYTHCKRGVYCCYNCGTLKAHTILSNMLKDSSQPPAASTWPHTTPIVTSVIKREGYMTKGTHVQLAAVCNH